MLTAKGQKPKALKLVITGGHHNSALAVLDELSKLGEHNYLWFGHRYTIWKDTKESAEYKEVTKQGINFIDLKAGKFYKTYNPAKLIRIPRGFFNAFYHLAKFKPDAVLSFGGYLAAPTALAAAILRIPIYTHEQTVVAGWSNLFISRFAKKVFVSWEESSQYFPKEKVVVTGLPLRKELLAIKKQPSTNKQLPFTIYITGGKQGSQVINKVVERALPKLLKEFYVIHQCGSVSFLNSKEVLLKAVKKLPKELQSRYIVEEYFFPEVLADIFKKANFVISRGGAHSVYELSVLAKPAIIIPIPWVSHNEQMENAKILEKSGSAIIIDEKTLNDQELIKQCENLAKNYIEYKKSAEKFSKKIKKDAASKIAAYLLTQ